MKASAKKIFVLGAILLIALTASARQACVTIQPINAKSVSAADSAVFAQSPANNKITYKDSADLAAQAQAIEAFFAEHPLENKYQLMFFDEGAKEFVGPKVVLGQQEYFKFSENADKNQLLYGIAAIVAALVCLLLFMAFNKRRVLRLLAVIFLIVGLFCALMGVIFLSSLGVKMVMKVLGPALIVLVVVLALGSGSSKKSRERTMKNLGEKTYESKPHGYSVNGKHFDTLGEAQMYVKQFDYMDNGWIKPD